MNRLPRIVERELDASGITWRIVDGGKHLKVFVADRFVAIYPKGGRSSPGWTGRQALNVRAQIRRAIRSST